MQTTEIWSQKHLFSTYLAEFMWRYMHRNRNLFAVFLNEVKKIYITYQGLKTKAQADERIRVIDEWKSL